MFLDARPVGAYVTHVFLPEDRVDPDFLIRWLHLQPPAGFKTVFRPRTFEDGRLHLTEGATVTFGFIEARPGDTSSDDSNSSSVGLDSGSEDGPGPDPNEPPRGPPPPTPLQGSDSTRRGGRNRRDRSRSSSRPHNGTARTAQFNSTACVKPFRPTLKEIPCKGLHGLQPCTSVPFRSVTFANFGFWTPFDWGFSTPTKHADVDTLSAKLLQEPVSSCQALQAAVAFLRYDAPRLGQGWRYVPPADAPRVDPDSGTASATGDSDDELSELHFVVLAPDFQQLRITIDLRLPATTQEAISRLQGQRGHADRCNFPQVLPASPQPCPGNGVVIALPAWCTTGHHFSQFLCFDTSLIDGRLFVAACPPYVSRRHLLHLAGLPLDNPIDVHAGCDPVPLANEGQHQVVHGETFVFVPRDAVVPTLHSLAQLLLSRREWSRTYTVPSMPDDGTYGLVHESESILYFSQFERPTAYRSEIASCVGLQQRNMRLFPSSPRADNAALQGHHCRTIIAVCESLPTSLPSFGVLIDARAILKGWRTWTAVAGQVSCIAIRVDVQHDAPTGWKVQLRGIPEDVDFLNVVPGQVLTVDVKPYAPLIDEPSDTVEHTSVEPHHSDRPGNSATAEDEGSPGEEDTSPPSGNNHEADTGGEGTSPAVADSLAYRTCPFLILGQGYSAERVEVRLPVDVSLVQALHQVSAARLPTDAARLPVIQAVFPQPQGSHALCIASPEWETSGAIVAVDCRSLDGRLFALHLVGRVTRGGLLIAAQIPEDADVTVYIGNQPWPLVDGPSVDLIPGELFFITPSGAPHHVVVSLQDMLVSPGGWTAFAHRGVSVRAVIAALNHTNFLPSQHSRPAICFVDARPILLSFNWQVCPDGLLDTGEVASRFAAQCPAGYSVCLLNSNAEELPLGQVVRIEGGDVFTAFFRPFQVHHDTAGGSDPPDDPFDDDNDDADDNDDPADHHAARPPEGGVATSHHYADTGGTDPASCSFVPSSAYGYSVMWFAKLFTCAVLAGTWQLTPVCPYTVVRELDKAVCISNSPAELPGRTLFVCPNTEVIVDVPASHDISWTSRSNDVVSTASPIDHVAYVIGNILHSIVLSGLYGCGLFILGLAISFLGVQCIGIGSAGPQGRRLWHTLLFLLLLPGALAMQDLKGEIESQAQAVGNPRPIPTPCRSHHTWPRVPPGVPVCISEVCPNPRDKLSRDIELELVNLVTLLEQSASHNHEWAFLAATLLDTLEEHFHPDCVHAKPLLCDIHTDLQAPVRSGQPNQREVTSPVVDASQTICLDSAISLTGFQAAVVALQEVVPPPICTHQEPDWLDDDLGPLLRSGILPKKWYHTFSGFRKWGSGVTCGHLRCLEIYTDGSADGGHHDTGQPCSWAFSVWAVTSVGRLHIGSAAHAAVPTGTPYHIGEGDDSSLTGELLALGWAATWAIEYGHRFQVPIFFCYDSTSAGFGSFGFQCRAGASNPATCGLSNFVCVLRQCLEHRQQVGHRHIPGHAGVIENELVDQLSKFARKAPEDSHNRCLPLWPSILFKHPLCAWAWMAHLRSPALPTLFAIESEAHRMQSQQLHSVQAPSFGIKQTCQIGKGIAFSFKLVSYNTLTLFDPTAAKGRAAREHVGLMIRGKRDLMKQQFLHANTWLIGLQETRLPETGTLPDKGFLMISSAATSEGSYGCALWVNLAQPFAYIGRTPCRAAREDIVVSSFSPRHLQVQIDTPWIRFTVLVAHGPSAIRNDDQAKLFWEQRRNELARRPEGSEVLLLVDANSCLGSIPSAAVGQHAQEAESAAGFHFHSFLLDVGCLLPATFADWHTGQSWTWTAPGDNPVRHRIDYVGVPERWDGFMFHSQIWVNFESLQTRLDHLPALLEVSFWKNLPPTRYVQAHRSSVRPSSEPTLTQRATVVATLSRAPQISWELDVDGHFSQLVPLLQQSVSSAIPDSEQTPQQPYLSVDTLQLVRWRSAFRAYIRVENAEQRRRLLSVIFAALYHHAQGTVFNPNTLALVPGWLAQIDISIARAVAALEELTNRIRRAIKLDRAAYLQGLVQNLSLKEVLQPKKLYAAVRKAFPQARSSRRSLLSPLPAIRMADGSLACSAEERNERWRGYFAEQEAGDVLTDSTYAEFFLHPDIPVQGQHTAFSVAALPTLSEVESSILSLKFRKASGPDGITAEILRIAPQAVAVTLYPLFLKATLAVREPVEWHGGNLIALAKRATKALECSGYRSTLLASVVGKIHHKILRSKLEPYLGATKSGLQAGTSAGVGVDMISLAVKAFRGWASHTPQTSAVTFYDIKAAYYHVLRQTLLRTSDCDRPLLHLLHRIGIPAAAVQELHDHLAKVALLDEAGVEEHLTALVSDLFRGTWFRLESSSTLTGTRRGTRPGDPLADLLFGFSFAGYLRSIDTTLAEAGLATTIPAAAESPPWWDWEPTTNTNHASWADDYVHLQLAEDQAQLVRHVLLSTRLHVEKASAVGMSLTFAKDKSAVLLSSRLDRSCIFEASTNEVGDWGFPIRDSVSGITHFLPIVDSYRHLGGILTANHRPGVDLAFRVAQASSVAKPLRKRLFGSQSIPLSVRCTILRSLVVSKFSFSCATADLHSAIHRRSWCQHYVNFWRMLCKRRFGQKPAHCYEVLHITGAPPPLLALAQARYTLIRRLLSFGPPDLLHMLHVHWRSGAGDAWLLQILADLKAVAMYSESAATVLQMSCPIVSFFEAVQQEPLWWKRQLRKAVKGFADDVKQWALAYHTDEATVVSPAAPTEPAKPFKCRWCEQSFVLHKHVAVHEARRHGALSPARHFAFVPWCVACMRFYHTIERVQNHLRNSHACLQRCAQVIAPLSLPEVRELEQEGKTYKARIRKGAWHTYQAATPAAVALGPRMPTRDEVLSGLDEHEILLGRLARLFRPEPSTLSWVDETCQRHTPEGPRTGSAEFWLTRPTVASRTVSPRI